MAPDTSEAMPPARAAAAAAAVDLVEPGTTIGLGSGRAVWAVAEGIGERWRGAPPVCAVCASRRTEEVARAAGIEVAELSGSLALDVAIDGADEVDAALGLVKGGGGALLREKIVVSAARRFVVVAEARKRVDVLGVEFPLPVEIVRFGWEQTRARVLALTGDATLRTADGGEPYVTDEGHLILDCRLAPGGDRAALAARLKALVGVVEHGLFLGMADLALLGRDDGTLERLGG